MIDATATHRRRTATLPVVAACLLAGLAACTKGPLHTAASMRVEVEVYKGPLSKTRTVQRGELIGLVNQAKVALSVYSRSAEQTLARYCPHPEVYIATAKAANVEYLSLFADKVIAKYETALLDGNERLDAANKIIAALDPLVTYTNKLVAASDQIRSAANDALKGNVASVTQGVVQSIHQSILDADNNAKHMSDYYANAKLARESANYASININAQNAVNRARDAKSNVDDAAKKAAMAYLIGQYSDSARAGNWVESNVSTSSSSQQDNDSYGTATKSLRSETEPGSTWRWIPDQIGCRYVLLAADAAGEMIQKLGYLDTDKIRSLTTSKFSLPSDPLKSEIAKLAEVGVELQAKAFYVAEAQISASPREAAIRQVLTDFTLIAADYGNIIVSRADVLLKQIEGDVKGSLLSTGDHLRDVSQTEFLHLYDWYKATSPASDLGLSGGDRVRLAQRLFSNHYWTKINEVHASGQGEVRMALIKDDIGNWNLKSFTNDPSELLEAYTNVTKAAIKALVDGIKDAGTGGVSPAVLNLASRVTTGKFGTGQSAAGLNVEALHDRVLDRFETLIPQAEERDRELSEAVAARSEAAKDAEASASTAQAQADEAKKNSTPIMDLPAKDSGKEPMEMADDAGKRAETVRTESESTMTSSFKIRSDAVRIQSDPGASVGHDHANVAIGLSDEAIARANDANRKARDAELEAGVAINRIGTVDNPIGTVDANRAKSALLTAVNAEQLLELSNRIAAAANASLAASTAAVAVAQAEAQRIQYRVEVLAAVRAMLDNHAAIIDVIKESVLTSAPAGAN